MLELLSLIFFGILFLVFIGLFLLFLISAIGTRDSYSIPIIILFGLVTILMGLTTFGIALPDTIFEFKKETVVQKAVPDYIKKYSNRVVYVFEDTLIEKTEMEWLDTNRINVRLEYYKDRTNKKFFLEGQD